MQRSSGGVRGHVPIAGGSATCGGRQGVKWGCEEVLMRAQTKLEAFTLYTANLCIHTRPSGRSLRVLSTHRLDVTSHSYGGMKYCTYVVKGCKSSLKWPVPSLSQAREPVLCQF